MLANQITDRERFLKIVAQAIADAEANCKKESERNRWIRAIAKAVAHIEQNGEFMTYDLSENHLVIWSQDSDRIYSANGTCECAAFLDGIKYRQCPYPCYHRAAARLMRNYFGMTENTSPSFPNKPQAALQPTSPPASLKYCVGCPKDGRIAVKNDLCADCYQNWASDMAEEERIETGFGTCDRDTFNTVFLGGHSEFPSAREDETAMYVGGGYRKADVKVGGFRL